MVTLSTVRFLYDYHYSMNTKMLTACEALTPEQWDQPLGHSWGSVHSMLAHMLAAEIIWLARWKGDKPTTLPRAESFPALTDVRRAWSAVEAELRAFLADCDETRLQADFTYTNTRGRTVTVPFGPLLLHVVNHGTHHRGELAAMLTVLDVPHPEDDLLYYLIERSGQTS